jgi:hypothetical protein
METFSKGIGEIDDISLMLYPLVDLAPFDDTLFWFLLIPLYNLILLRTSNRFGQSTTEETQFVEMCIWSTKIGTVDVLHAYSKVNFLYIGPSEIRPSLNISRFLKSLLDNSLQRKSHKTGHLSKHAISFGPSAGRFREVSL